MKRVNILLSILILFFTLSIISAQGDDKVLFTVNSTPVQLSEFDYIYNKNNGDKADYSKANIQEYLDLYIKFKLKVQKARDMKLDTIPELISELAGYRKQLADSYLTDKEVTENLIKEVYDRQQYEVKVRHILIKADSRATDARKMEAKKQIEDLRKEIVSGTSFSNIAMTHSQDATTRNEGGELNYLTAMLPNGYYAFENAMYSLKPGEVSEPVLSNVGYHLIQLIDKRSARGNIEGAHILIRKKDKNLIVPNVKGKIDSIFQLLNQGANFEELAKKYSQDANSSDKGGNIGIFGSGTYETTFENAIFSLEKNGDYSRPVETSLGWHIVKRVNKPENDSYEKARRKLQVQIRNDSRYEISRNQMIEQIKIDANLKENKEVLKDFYSNLDESFYSFNWQIDPNNQQTLLSLDGNDYTVLEFATYCKNNTKTRLRNSKTNPLQNSVEELYDEYLHELCLKYEENNLENKYPDFKALMREYEEGILLFEATKLNVWDKASQDTSGLRVFFEKNRNNYLWKERANLETYVIKTTDEKLIKKITKYIKKNTSEKVLAKYSTEQTPISFSEGIFERGDLEVAGIKFTPKSISDARPNFDNKTFTIRKITNTTPATPKTLKDARGYIIADYQDYLDKKWIEKLKNEYEVVVNKDVLNSIIK